ncbi:hypothetical protein SAMN04488156_12512 [Bacillus sp. 166amftsu]|nr:hypothetical protein SAMN04488156_12512 [Bacillus sp. 166amftsu]
MVSEQFFWAEFADEGKGVPIILLKVKKNIIHFNVEERGYPISR